MTSTSSKCGACSVSPRRKTRLCTAAAIGRFSRTSRIIEASATITFGAHGSGGGSADADRKALLQALAQLVERGALSGPANFLQQVIRQGHPGGSRSHLELPMQFLRDVAELNHFPHADNIGACGQHVNMLSTR